MKRRSSELSWVLGLALAGVGALTPRPAEAKPRTIIVRNATELIQAIGSNRRIEVTQGIHQLDSVPRKNTKHVTWTKVHDGWQLNITNVTNLTITSSGSTKPRLLVKARYAWVIQFDKARNVHLHNLILGHIPAGGCVGGVVGFKKSRNIRITHSELFGSGTIGVGLDQVRGFRMESSTIRDCTYGILSIKNSSLVRFVSSRFKGNAEFDLIEVIRSRNVRFHNCVVEGNRTNRGGGYALFKLDKRSTVVLHGGSYRNNTIDTFVNEPKRLHVRGSKAFRKSVKREMNRPDPRFNQIYKLVRYRQWLVTGSQAGIVFWDPATDHIDVVHKAFISSSFLIQGKYLWAGTYSYVFRFDGITVKRYLRSSNARGHAVFRGPNGGAWARRGRRYWRYDTRADRLVRTTPAWAPKYSAHDVVFRKNRARWSINFMREITRYGLGTTRRYRLRSTKYPGRDPRAFYQAPNGTLWVSDFDSGFYRYDPTQDRFIHDPAVSNKGSGIAVDIVNKRTWLGHYTKGVYLKRPNKPTRFFGFNHGYMRDILADPNGDLWVGGWNGLVRLYRQNGTWQREPFVIR